MYNEVVSHRLAFTWKSNFNIRQVLAHPLAGCLVGFEVIAARLFRSDIRNSNILSDLLRPTSYISHPTRTYPNTAFSIYSIFCTLFSFSHIRICQLIIFVIRKAIELHRLTYPIALATRNIVSRVSEAKSNYKNLGWFAERTKPFALNKSAKNRNRATFDRSIGAGVWSRKRSVGEIAFSSYSLAGSWLHPMIGLPRCTPYTQQTRNRRWRRSSRIFRTPGTSTWPCQTTHRSSAICRQSATIPRWGTKSIFLLITLLDLAMGWKDLGHRNRAPETTNCLGLCWKLKVFEESRRFLNHPMYLQLATENIVVKIKRIIPIIEISIIFVCSSTVLQELLMV